ncbi:uncharacterized protein [Excalfactoria chinensis]|uniref:uncharacterized protein n=1 Tax=Excalfactoria chinensis TaxID=46218 RepID=UPI003B3A9703
MAVVAPTSRLSVRRAAAKRAAPGPQPAAPEQKRLCTASSSSQPPSRAPLRALSVPAASGPGPPRKAMTVTAAPRAGKGSRGAALVPRAAPSVGGAQRRRAAWDLKGQLNDVRVALGNQKERAQRLEEENGKLREEVEGLKEELREKEERGEEMERCVSTLSAELAKLREESELKGRELEELTARLHQAQADLHHSHSSLAQRDSEVAELKLRVESQGCRMREQEESYGAEVAELRSQSQSQQQRLQEMEKQQHLMEMDRRRPHNMVQKLEADLHHSHSSLAQRDSEVAELKLRVESQGCRMREQEESYGAEVAQLRSQSQSQQQRLQEMEKQQHLMEMDRRRLHNMVQELKGNIRVFCRVRPLLAAELQLQNNLQHLHFPAHDSNAIVLIKGEQSHTAAFHLRYRAKTHGVEKGGRKKKIRDLEVPVSPPPYIPPTRTDGPVCQGSGGLAGRVSSRRGPGAPTRPPRCGLPLFPLLALSPRRRSVAGPVRLRVRAVRSVAGRLESRAGGAVRAALLPAAVAGGRRVTEGNPGSREEGEVVAADDGCAPAGGRCPEGRRGRLPGFPSARRPGRRATERAGGGTSRGPRVVSLSPGPGTECPRNRAEVYKISKKEKKEDGEYRLRIRLCRDPKWAPLAAGTLG